MDELADILLKIDRLRNEVKDMTLSPNKELELWTKFRLEWNYNSNHIEGNTLTYGQTELLLIRNQVSGDHDARAIDEMRAHDVAVDNVRSWSKDDNRIISEADIRELNKTILVRPFKKKTKTNEGVIVDKTITPGVYKQSANHVELRDGSLFKFSEPEDVQPEMQALIEWYRREGTQDHVVVTAAMLHYRMVCIHPFDDGNGRVSRLIMNYHLLKNGFPPVIIESSDKDNYYKALSRADTGDVSAFMKYIAEQLIWSFDLLKRAMRGDDITEKADWQKEMTLLRKRLEAKSHEEKVKSRQVRTNIESHLDLYMTRILEEVMHWFNPFSNIFKYSKLNIRSFGAREIWKSLPLDNNDIEEVNGELDKIFEKHKEAERLPVSIFIHLKEMFNEDVPTTQASVNFSFSFENDFFIVYGNSKSEVLKSISYGEEILTQDLNRIEARALEVRGQIESLLKN